MSPIPTRSRALFLSAAVGVAAWAHAVPTIDVQPQITVAATSGQAAAFSVQASGVGTVRYQWRRMGGDLAGRNGSSFSIPDATVADAGYYDVVVTDDTGSITSTPSRLIVAPKSGYPDTLRLDTSFTPLMEIEGCAMDALAVGPDGGVFVSGDYTMIAGERRKGLVRFNSDLTLDFGFVSAVGEVRQVLVQPDGRLLVNRSSGVSRINLGGSLDPSFSAAFSYRGSTASVDQIDLQPDGKVLVRGSFDLVNGIARSGVVRLHPDGSLDRSFGVVLGANDTVYMIKSVGSRIAILGSFYKTGGSVNQLRVLDENGVVVATTSDASSLRFSSSFLEADENGGIYIVRGDYQRCPVNR